jgi:hypothetical protein
MRRGHATTATTRSLEPDEELSGMARELEDNQRNHTRVSGSRNHKNWRILTTSIQAQPPASYPPFFPKNLAMNATIITPITSPHHMPSTARLTLCVLPIVKPQICGKNCEYMITVIAAPCAANRKSLKRTVVSGASGCRYAYCERIVGE